MAYHHPPSIIIRKIQTLVGILCCVGVTLPVATHAQGLISGAGYRGLYLGPLTSRKHNVSGEVFIVDSRTIHLRSFTYDGTGPDAFFWTGFTETPGPQGIIIPNERGTKEVLRRYNNEDLTISLPDGLTLRDIKWIAVWCRAYEVNFGDIYIPHNLDYPQPHVIGSLSSQHGVSSGPIVVVDAQTILVPDFTYSGQAPDCHFWVGRGIPGPNGIRIPDETGSSAPLQKSDKKTMVLSLPSDLTVFDIDYFGVWCSLYSLDFGHVRITPGLNVPPSLRMLGVAPQSKLNCEVLHEDSAFEIRWSVVESGETIVFQLVGRIDAGSYMGFGLSGEDDRSVMVGGDVMIGWFDQTSGRGNVMDYHLGSKSVCAQDGTGVCPDVRIKDGANNVRLLSAAWVNGFTILTFQRRLRALDPLDKRIRTNGTQPVIWAIGRMEGDPGVVGYHQVHNEDLSIDFGRSPKWNCPEGGQGGGQGGTSELAVIGSTSAASKLRPTSVEFPTTTTTTSTSTTTTTTSATTTSTTPPSSSQDQGLGGGEDLVPLAHPNAWDIPPIPCHEPEDGIFYVHVGPSGRKDVLRLTTGKDNLPKNVWYINGLLMPEVYLVRNKNYTFVVQGGYDNGFYITTDPMGDLQHSPPQFVKTGVFAGVEFDALGNAKGTALGKLCGWMENSTYPAGLFSSYAAYQRSLTLDCGKGHSGMLQFTPNENTPNLVYYQSFSRPDMGWKIHILDHCGPPGSIMSPPLPTPPQSHSNHHHHPHVVDQSIGESSNVGVFTHPHQNNLVIPLGQPIMANFPLNNIHRGPSMVGPSAPHQLHHHHHNHPHHNNNHGDSGSGPGYLIDPMRVVGGSGNFPNLQVPLRGKVEQGSRQQQQQQIVGSPGVQGPGFHHLPPPPRIYQIAMDNNPTNPDVKHQQHRHPQFSYQPPPQPTHGGENSNGQNFLQKRNGPAPQGTNYQPEVVGGFYDMSGKSGNQYPFPPMIPVPSASRAPPPALITITPRPQLYEGSYIITTMGPPPLQRRNYGPFIGGAPPPGQPQQQQRGQGILQALPGPPPRWGGPPGSDPELKYVEHPIIQGQGPVQGGGDRGPSGGSGGGSSNTPIWIHSRNLPKRGTRDPNNSRDKNNRSKNSSPFSSSSFFPFRPHWRRVVRRSDGHGPHQHRPISVSNPNPTSTSSE